MKSQFTIIMAALVFLMPTAVISEDAAKESGIPTVKITLHPMAEPRPVLRYKFLPSYIDRKPGNAALFYNKILIESHAIFNDGKMCDNAIAWAEAPLSDLRKQDVRSTINGWKGKIDAIKRASLCEYCDWQFPIREQGFETPLPELQQTRNYARLLAPYARMQIAEGKYDEAVETLQSGYALARDVGNGQFLIQCLVGSAIANMISNQVQEFIQQPDAPNLYWALTILPAPMLDYHSGWEGEQDAIYLTFPELQHLDRKDLAPDQWRILFEQSIQKAFRLGLDPSKAKENPTAISAFLVMQKYSIAKSFLIERGWAADKVETMPVCQVVLIAAMRQYEEIRDDFFKWTYLPYAEAIKGMSSYDSKLRAISQSGQEILPIASMFLPALSSAKRNEIKGERQIDSLRVLEAIRLYAAAHEGRLPEKLDDITEVPLPLDPLYGKPFIYYLVGDKAILESPAPKGMPPESWWMRYEITLKSKGQ
jgi:hypothetical protein